MARRRCWMTETVIRSTAKAEPLKEVSPRSALRARRFSSGAWRRTFPLRVLCVLRGSSLLSLCALRCQIFHRRGDAALAVLHAGVLGRHLDGGEGAEQHRLV